MLSGRSFSLLSTVVVSLGLAGALSAAPIQVNGSVTATSGPHSGSSAPFSFTFDDSVIPAGGGIVIQAGLIDTLSFTWNGINHDATTANTGVLGFSATGALTTFVFGTNCDAAGSGIVLGTAEGWLLASNRFRYSLGTGEVFQGDPTFTVSYPGSANDVPEPSSVLLIGGGLAGLVLSRYRRRTLGAT